jgi:hypothetical protein
VILTKWIIIGRRRDGRYPWDKSSYCQRWQIHLALSRFIYKGYGNGGVLAPLTGTIYIVWYFRALGAKIGKNCAIYASGKAGLMTEPDLVHVSFTPCFTSFFMLIHSQLGDDVNLDDCSVVAHINSRGNFALNSLKIGNGYAICRYLRCVFLIHLFPVAPCAPVPDFSREPRWRTAACSANILS